jgi:hypothetical protein
MERQRCSGEWCAHILTFQFQFLAQEPPEQGDELFSKEKYQEAYIPYLEAVEIWPSNFDYYIKLTLTYSKLGWCVPSESLIWFTGLK